MTEPTMPTTPTTPTKFRKRPVVIEAMQIRDGNEPIPSTGPLTPNEFDVACVSGWMLGRGFRGFKVHGDGPFGIAIETLEGVMVASPGDWIIRGVSGEFHPCKPDIFAATYEPAEETR